MAKNDGQRCHRCAHCDQDWPYIERYKECPICKQDTFTTTSHDVPTYSQAIDLISDNMDRIEALKEIERKMDEALVASALASLDEELGSLLC